MKKKQRRSPAKTEKASDVTPNDASSADATSSEADSSGAASETSDAAASGKKKTSLPAFGFASDLLKKKKASDDEAPAAPAAEASPDGDTPASAPTSDADGDTLAPTRIFDFVDRLDSAVEEEERRPVRLETFVTFQLADEVFAIPVEPVRQVVRVSDITRVPHAPRPIRGVTNLRGRVIPVIDLRLRIGLEEMPIGRSTRVVAVASRGRVLGLLVDAVLQVVHLDLDQVQPPPDDVMTVQSDYIHGVYDREDGLILLLDIDRALIIREAGAA